MWELNIEINEQNISYLKYISSNLLFTDFSPICVIENNVLSVACENKHKEKLIKKLKNLVAETIVLIYKEEYFVKNINLTGLNNDYKTALIKCLVMFDFEDDLYYVLDELEFNYNINIHSFYIFRLGLLKSKWEDIKHLTEISNGYLQSETLIELIKFLIYSITPKRNVVNIFFNGNTFVLSDESNAIIKLNGEAASHKKEIDLITTLITLSPKKINLHCINSLTEQTFSILYYIFNKKINLIV